MEQAAAMNVPDCARGRLHQSGRHARRKGFRQSFLQGAAGDVFEHQEEPPVRLAVIIERYDVRVPDSRYRTRLAQPAAPRASARFRPRDGRQNLQSDRAIQARLDRQVHHAHTTPAQFGLDLETRDARPWLRGRHDDFGIAAPMGEPLQDRLTFRAALDMLFDGGVSPLTERIGAKQE